MNPFPEGAEPKEVTNTCVMGLPHNDWLCNECISPRLAVCVKSSSVFGYFVTTWNYWECAKDFGMSLQIRHFTLK